MLLRLLASLLFTAVLALPLRAQLAITEVFPSASTNGTEALHADWWELTNFGPAPVDVSGYRFNDSNGGLTNGAFVIESLVLAPGESVIFFEQDAETATPSVVDFQAWWGVGLGATRVFPYATNGLGLSANGDSVRLWNATTTDPDDLLALVEFGAATTGASFTYDPATGVFGTVSTVGTGGAFAAADNGDVASPGATTGIVALTVDEFPADQAVNPLATATFSVVARGMPAPRYQWFFGDSLLAGATRSTLIVTKVTEAQVGAYRVRLDTGLTNLLSEPAQLTLTAQPTPPSFVQPPVDVSGYVGGQATFTALATGVPPPSYQWFRGATPLTGETNSTLILSPLTFDLAGTYSVTASNPSGSTNLTATLAVHNKPDLRITEVQSSAALDAEFQIQFGFSKQDWWELTSFAHQPVNLQGWRFDDNSASLANAIIITNDLTLQPGESIILVEILTAEQFRTWWGAAQVPESIRIISYTGAGISFSSGGDGIRLWDATTTQNADTIASVDFGAADPGITFNYDPDTGEFGGKSELGIHGVFAAEAFAAGGQDIGSPGRIREGLPIVAPIVSVGATPTGVELRFTGQAGRVYQVETRPALTVGTWTATGDPVTPLIDGQVTLSLSAPDAAGYFRVRVE